MSLLRTNVDRATHARWIIKHAVLPFVKATLLSRINSTVLQTTPVVCNIVDRIVNDQQVSTNYIRFRTKHSQHSDETF